MADPSVDVAALSAEQQLALQQYTAVTDQETSQAIPLLARCQWNVQIAIARFFDGEPAEDAVAAAAVEHAAPQDIRRQERLLNGFSSTSPPSSRRSRIEAAPRVVPQPESQVSTQVPLVLALIFAPFSLVYSLMSKSFRFIAWMFPFLPQTWGRLTASNINTPASRSRASGRRPLNPRDTAARFIREFEEEYGAHELPFFESGYAQAFDQAKKNLQFLMVVLISPEHDATASFIRDTLLSPAVTSFIRDPANNILLWAGSLQDSEAYQVSTALTCTTFPFTALIVHTPQVSATAMGIAARIPGPTTPSHYIAKLQSAIHTHSTPLASLRDQRAQNSATRSIRQEQDSAYQRSLATDRERARLRKLSQDRHARRAEQERDRQRAEAAYQRNLASWRKWRAARIAPEPPAQAQNVVRISLRMRNAERVVRRFDGAARIEEVYAFVECFELLAPETATASGSGLEEKSEPEPMSEAAAHDRHSMDLNNGNEDENTKAFHPHAFTYTYPFRLCTPMPREVFDVHDAASIRERVGRSGNLIVEDVEEGEEEGADADADANTGDSHTPQNENADREGDRGRARGIHATATTATIPSHRNIT